MEIHDLNSMVISSRGCLKCIVVLDVNKFIIIIIIIVIVLYILLPGYNANGSHWELLTDIPWLPSLASAPDLPAHKLKADDRKREYTSSSGRYTNLKEAYRFKRHHNWF